MLPHDRTPLPGFPGKRSTRATRRARISAALTAVTFVLASLLGVLHEATTSHIRCAAHGELVDSVGVAGPVTAARSASATIDRAQHSARPHGDDHCLMASSLHESKIAPRSPGLAAVQLVRHELAIAASAADQPRGAILYRIAPKTSPPA